MTSVGARDRVVTIQQITEGKSSTGFPTESWTTLGTVMMAKLNGSGSERFTVEQVAAEIEDVWITYYRADMDPEAIDVPKTRRLLMSGRVYDIVRARALGFHKDIEISTRAASGVAP